MRATDQGGLSVERDLTVAVTDVDEGVTAADDGYAAAEDAVLTVAAADGVLADDAAPDGGRQAVAGTIATALAGTVRLAADGSFAYAPAANANGADSFSYTLRGADGDEATGTVRLDVTAVNSAPHFDAERFVFALNENNAVGAALGRAGASDPDGDALAHGIAENEDADATNDVPFAVGPDGIITATRPLNHEAQASYAFTRQATDGAGLTDTAAVTVDVGDVVERTLDLVTANFHGNSVGVLLQDGQGGFARTDVAVGDGACSVVLGDLDGAGGLTPSGLPDLGPYVPTPAETDAAWG